MIHLNRQCCKPDSPGIRFNQAALIAGAGKLLKKVRKPKILVGGRTAGWRLTKTVLARELFNLAERAQAHGWSAEELLCGEIKKQERQLRQREAVQGRSRAR